MQTLALLQRVLALICGHDQDATRRDPARELGEDGDVGLDRAVMVQMIGSSRLGSTPCT